MASEDQIDFHIIIVMILHSVEPKMSSKVLNQVITLCHCPSVFNHVDP